MEKGSIPTFCIDGTQRETCNWWWLRCEFSSCEVSKWNSCRPISEAVRRQSSAGAKVVRCSPCIGRVETTTLERVIDLFTCHCRPVQWTSSVRCSLLTTEANKTHHPERAELATVAQRLTWLLSSLVVSNTASFFQSVDLEASARRAFYFIISVLGKR